MRPSGLISTTGQTGDNRPIGGKAGQPFKQIGIKHLIDCTGCGACRVKMRRFELHANGDIAAGAAVAAWIDRTVRKAASMEAVLCAMTEVRRGAMRH